MNLAYWLGPAGERRELRYATHISDVNANPEVFGVAHEWIVEVHQRYGEKLGTEGSARLEIIRALVARGWIRVRWRTDRWDVSCNELDPSTRQRLADWAAEALRTVPALDRHQPVYVTAIGGPGDIVTNLDSIANLAALSPASASANERSSR